MSDISTKSTDSYSLVIKPGTPSPAGSRIWAIQPNTEGPKVSAYKLYKYYDDENRSDVPDESDPQGLTDLDDGLSVPLFVFNGYAEEITVSEGEIIGLVLP